MKPRLLDLCCKAGGASVGYDRAGFDVVGVDIEPQPHYPFEFHQADALEFLATADLSQFDAFHGSPPCKGFTKTGWAFHFGYHERHPDILTPMREALKRIGKPWVIENVPGAPMRPDVILCGSQFRLELQRHRWFELGSGYVPMLAPCNHDRPVFSPHGNTHYKGEGDDWARALAIDWMNAAELSQAIPPAYTEFIGAMLLSELAEVAA